MSDEYEALLDGEIQPLIKNVLEADVQETAIRWVRERGWWARKFSSPANRAIPDYIIGKDMIVLFPEFKKPGRLKEKNSGLSKDQVEEHKKMREAGLAPTVFDNVQQFKAYITQIEELTLDRIKSSNILWYARGESRRYEALIK